MKPSYEFAFAMILFMCDDSCRSSGIAGPIGFQQKLDID